MLQASRAADPPATKSAATAPVVAPSTSGTIEMVPERPAAPIPYRKESDGAGGSLIGVLAITVLLLVVFVVTLRAAKSRGLLDRWIVSTPSGGAASRNGRDAMRVEQALRVSPRTTLYRIRDGEHRFLLIESIATNARLQPLRDGDDTFSTGDEHDNEH